MTTIPTVLESKERGEERIDTKFGGGEEKYMDL
jgi:hypothetical protein